jgi:hypothetical protein
MPEVKVHPGQEHEGPEEMLFYTFFNIGVRWGGRSTPRSGSFSSGNQPLPILHEAGWAPRSVWTDVENLAPTGLDPRSVQSVASRYTD